MTKCTKCGRNRRGHVGPCGRRCTEEPLLVSLDSSDSYDDTSTSDGEETEFVEYTVGKKKKVKPAKKISKTPKVKAPDPVPEVAKSDSIAMSELIKQVGLLTTSMQSLSDQNRSILTKQELHSKKLEVLNSGGAGHVVSGAVGGVEKDPPIPIFNGARVSMKTVKSARAGEFINLIEFVPNSEPSSALESIFDERTGQIVFKTKAVRRTIDGFLAWSQAWSGYESVLMESNPELYLSFTKYRSFIQKCDAVYVWGSVYSYDQRHRHKCSMCNSLNFETVDTDIYVTLMNAQTTKPNAKACFRCSSLDHIAKNCTFLEEAQMAPTPTSFGKKPRFGGQGSGPGSTGYQMSRFGQNTNRASQICYNFNAGRCYIQGCQRLHVCQQCGGPEPLFRCPRCSASKMPATNNAHPSTVSAPNQAQHLGPPFGAAQR